MVSSGVYRYFASRDELLTALIVEAYDALGATAERASRRSASKPPLDRWLATCRAIRRWARHIRTSTPSCTARRSPATKRRETPSLRLSASRGRWSPSPPTPHATGGCIRRRALDVDVPARLQTPSSSPSVPSSARRLSPDDLVRLVAAWSQVFGMITFELFGQTANAITAHEQLFDATARTMGLLIGLEER